MPKSLEKLLPKRSSKSRFQAVWVWNAALDPEEIAHQLEELKKKEIFSVVIRPTPELRPRYLSEDFFDCLNLALEHATKLGMEVRVAECLAGGGDSLAYHLARDSRDIRLATLKYVDEWNLRMSRVFAQPISDAEDSLLLAIRSRNGEAEQSSLKKLGSFVRDGQLTWRAPRGEWTVLQFKEQTKYAPMSGYQIDFFNPKISAEYCSQLFGTFKEQIEPKYWKRAFRGFVFELPYIGPSAREIYWSEALRNKFRAKFHQDLLRVLPILFCNGGKRTNVLRDATYSFMQSLFSDAFLGQLTKANRKYRLSNNCYSWGVDPYYPEDCLLNVPAADKASQLNGAHVGFTDAPEAPVVSKITNRSLSFGKPTIRTFLGQSPVSASATLQSLKWEIDRQVLCGSRNWVFEGLPYRPSPRSHPYAPNNPFIHSESWKHLPQLLAYTRAFSKLCENTTQQKRALIIFPRSSLYGAYCPTDLAEYNRIKAAMSDCGRLCSEAGMDYDVASETELLTASLRRGRIALAGPEGRREYDVVLMPRFTVIPKKVAVRFRQIAAKAIPVYWIGTMPLATAEEGTLPTLRKKFEELRNRFSETFKSFESASGAEADIRAASKSPIQPLASDRLPEDVQVIQLSGRQQYFVLFNQSESQSRNLDIFIKASGKLYLADFDKLEVYRFPKALATEGGYQVNLDLQPKQIYVLVATRSAIRTAKGHLFETLAGLERKYRIVFKNKWEFKPDCDNVLPLTFWNMRISSNREGGGYYRFLETYLEVEDLPKSLKLILNGVVNQPIEEGAPINKHVEIAINGVRLKELEPRSTYGESQWAPSAQTSNKFLGVKSLEADIAGMVHKGFNRISIRALGNHHVPVNADYPLYVTGDFALKRGSRGWVLCNNATMQEYTSWTENGYPYYSGPGTYSQTFERPDTFRRLVIKFRKVEEIAEVKINGQDVATFPYEPMEIDVTTRTFQGKNLIAVKVSNTIDDVIRLDSRPSGLVGEVFLDVY